jgi:uncharacterized protein (DUF1778 family)
MPTNGSACKVRIELRPAKRIILSERDSLRVAEILENPPEPSPTLVAAMRRRAGRRIAGDSSKKVK